MTEPEQELALARMVRRYSAAKTRRVALISEAQRLGGLLEAVGKSLREVNAVKAFADGKPESVARTRDDLAVRPLPTHAEITAIVDELRSVSADVRELRDQLKEAGVSFE